MCLIEFYYSINESNETMFYLSWKKVLPNLDNIAIGSKTLSLSIIHNSIVKIWTLDNILSWNNPSLTDQQTRK